MDAIITALGGLLLKALPTFLLIVVLHFYLKLVFFTPLDKVLRARHQATEGARAGARASLETASQKAAEYEAAIRAARTDIHKEREETRRKWSEEQASALGQSRRNAAELVRGARSQLGDEAAAARQLLETEAGLLADEIAGAILRGRRS
jgi:F-type H+-transporting ATPase subunit b